MLSNQQIAQKLREVAAAYTIKGENQFKIIAYEKAAENIEKLVYDLEDVWREGKLQEIPGIGANIASYLDELFQKGQVKHFEEIKKGLPKAMFSLLNLPGFGAKKAYKLASALKIGDKDDPYQALQKAVFNHKIAKIEGFGQKSEEEIGQILANLEKKQSQFNKILLPYAFEIAQKMIAYLKRSPAVEQVYPLGSLRRMLAMVGDIDLAVVSEKPKEVIQHFINYPSVKKIIEKGEVTSSIVLKNGVQIDLRVQSAKDFGALLQHFTGSKQHNIHLREYALKKGFSLSEYGIKKIKDQTLKRFAKEEDFYRYLGLSWIPPELREDRGEIEAAKKQFESGGGLPKLVEFSDIKGDLHLHSNYDLATSHDLGLNSFTQIRKKAEQLGYQYIGFSDHNPAFLHNSSEVINKIMKRRKLFIDQFIYSTKFTRVKIFNMLEVDILVNGNLALPKESFVYVDALIVSIHSSFKLPKEKMTQRILQGLSFPKVRIFGHPTGRLLGKREGIQADWEEIFAFCRKKQIALEINANPYRLDLPDMLIQSAARLDCKFIINTDAHCLEEMDLMNFGVSVARRGWLEKDAILNTLDFDHFKDWLLQSS